MPVIHVEMWPGRTVAQKREVAKAITEAMVQHHKHHPGGDFRHIYDVAKENWAQAGELASET